MTTRRIILGQCPESQRGQFRKKPIVIEAEQYLRQRHIDTGYVPEGVRKVFCADEDGAMVERQPVVDTLEGTSYPLQDGDWVIKGIKGEYYPCKPDVFEATYERV